MMLLLPWWGCRNSLVGVANMSLAGWRGCGVQSITEYSVHGGG